MGKIFYIMGKSASGKDNIYSRLAAHKELNLKTLVLYTTRPIRAGEQDGKNYYFADDAKLEEFRKNGNLIEARAYHTVHGIWTYFTADDGQVDLKGNRYAGIFYEDEKLLRGRCRLSCLYPGGRRGTSCPGSEKRTGTDKSEI